MSEDLSLPDSIQFLFILDANSEHSAPEASGVAL